MLVIAAVVFVAVNFGAWVVGGGEAIANIPLWGAFVVLNVVSVLWATSILGLHPLGVALSYVVGGALAYFGSKGTEGLCATEIMTAGATYGAFGALAVGNISTQVRFVFFQKKQVPFIFVIVGLLVVDAVLNSQISQAGGRVLVFGVVLPFVVAGAGIGLVWSLVNNRAGVERPAGAKVKAVATKKKSAPVAKKKEPVKKEPVAKKEKISEAPKKPAPKLVVPKVTPPPVEVPVVEEKKVSPVKKEVPAVVEKVAPVVAEKKPVEDVLSVESDDDAFSISSFDASLFFDGASDDDDDDAVQVDEPILSVSSVEEPEKEEAVVSDPQDDASLVEDSKEQSEDDWLGGLLNSLDKAKK